MVKFDLVALTFKGPVHFGDDRGDYGSSESTYHSDSLYAAMMASLAMLGEEIPTNGDLGFSVSSLFPFTTINDRKVYFFPRPFVNFNMSDDTIEGKRLKKIGWLDQHYYEKVLRAEDCGDFNGGADLQGPYLSRYSIAEEMSSKQVRPRVSVARSAEENDGDTRIYYIDQQFFREGSGLYFLVLGDTEKMEKALRVLKDNGIGTDRSVGYGQFDYTFEKLQMDCPNHSTYMTNISLYCPENATALNGQLQEGCRYDIIQRGGWTSSESSMGLRKKTIKMFKEGSVLRAELKGAETFGSTDIDLKPDEAQGIDLPKHPIFRNGRAIFLPIQINDQR